jgi:manganese transport protein
VYLNIKMLLNETATLFFDGSWFLKLSLLALGLLFLGLLGYISFFPLLTQKTSKAPPPIHPAQQLGKIETPPVFKHIAIALDFSANDNRLLSFAIGQGGGNAQMLLIHVVESASAGLLGANSDDMETRKDQERLNEYCMQLSQQGISATGMLGYRHRSTEIVRLVKATHADLLIMGAHRHTGIKDMVYGETVNSVRHELDIPVLIVNV